MSQRHDMERTRKQKSVLWILSQLRIILADSRTDVGHCWDLDQRRYAQSCRKRSSYLSCHHLPGKRRIKKQRERSLFTSTVVKNPSTRFFARVSTDRWFVQMISKDSVVAEKPAANKIWNTYRTCCWSSHQRGVAGTFAARLWNMNSNNFLKTRNYPNCAPTPVWRLL